MSSCSADLFAQSLEPSPLLVAAASDLAPLEQPLREAFDRARVPVRFAFGSSGQLAAQIRNGAPFDLFLAANFAYVRQLETTGHVEPGSVAVYATGRLALWSKSGKFRTLEDLDSPSLVHLAIANPAHAPYGLAARQTLESVDLWEKLKPKIVFGENVRQTLQFAERGNADAALTAWTLVHDKGGVRISDKFHEPVSQTGGVVSRSARKKEAARLLEFLRSAAGRQLLGKYGLFPPK